MEIRDATVLVLGGTGLVGRAVGWKLLAHGPRRVVVAALLRDEAEEAAAELERDAPAGVAVEPRWGDLFVPRSSEHRARDQVLGDPELRGALIDDLYGELTDEVFSRSALGALLTEVAPDLVVDAVNTAGALAYQDVFQSADHLRELARTGAADPESVERHLSTLYLPQLIRHVQIALEGMTRVGTKAYVKIGTAGTGGMGLNIPFTHSEERPSRVLLAKAGVAGAHSLLLYLMARTPGAPAVKEIKPTAAITWKSLGHGAISRGGRPVPRVDATEPLAPEEAFTGDEPGGWRVLDTPLSGVYLDAGENGLFSLPEFEALSALGLMEFVTPEEIADHVLREIRGHATGRDVVAALDASTTGPTYRAGVMRGHAIRRMEEMEREHGEEGVAYEMLGPPRLSKLLFEGAVLRRLHETVEAGAELDPEETARSAGNLLERDGDLRQRILSIGLPILLPDGDRVLRGPGVKVPPPDDRAPTDPRVVDAGWVDLRPANWSRWRERIRSIRQELASRPDLEKGSRADHEHGDEVGELRPGRLAAWVFRHEDQGERIKR